MNYEQTKNLLISAMQVQNYAADTQKKFKASLAYIFLTDNGLMTFPIINAHVPR